MWYKKLKEEGRLKMEAQQQQYQQYQQQQQQQQQHFREKKEVKNTVMVVLLVLLVVITLVNGLVTYQITQRNEELTQRMGATIVILEAHEKELRNTRDDLNKNSRLTLELCRYLGLGY
jgi:Mg2+/citrate symporter